jgi:hypothetical protein
MPEDELLVHYCNTLELNDELALVSMSKDIIKVSKQTAQAPVSEAQETNHHTLQTSNNSGMDYLGIINHLMGSNESFQVTLKPGELKIDRKDPVAGQKEFMLNHEHRMAKIDKDHTVKLEEMKNNTQNERLKWELTSQKDLLSLKYEHETARYNLKGEIEKLRINSEKEYREHCREDEAVLAKRRDEIDRELKLKENQLSELKFTLDDNFRKFQEENTSSLNKTKEENSYKINMDKMKTDERIQQAKLNSDMQVEMTRLENDRKNMKYKRQHKEAMASLQHKHDVQVEGIKMMGQLKPAETKK